MSLSKDRPESPTLVGIELSTDPFHSAISASQANPRPSADEVSESDFLSSARIRNFKHEDVVYCVCFEQSPDGKCQIATGCGDKFARIWDVQKEEKAIWTSEMHGAAVLSVCFSPDGKNLVTGTLVNNETNAAYASVFDIASGITGKNFGKMIMQTTATEHRISSVCFSPDSKSFATSCRDRSVCIFDFEGDTTSCNQNVAPKMKFKLQTFADSVHFSSDGQYLAVGCADKNAHVYKIDKDKGELILSIHHEARVNSVHFSTDGASILTGCSDNMARIFHFPTGLEILKTRHEGKKDIEKQIHSACFSFNKKLIATGSSDGYVRIIDIDTNHVIYKKGFGNSITHTCFSPDNKWMACSTKKNWTEDKKNKDAKIEGQAHVFALVPAQEIPRPIVTFRHGELDQLLMYFKMIDRLCFSRDGKRIATGCNDGFARIFDVEGATKKEIFKTIIHGNDADTRVIWSICFSCDGTKLATSSGDKIVRIFKITAGDEFVEPFIEIPHQEIVRSVSFAPDGRIATGCNDMFAYIFDADGKQILKMQHDGRVSCVCFSHDGTRIATGVLPENIPMEIKAEKGDKITPIPVPTLVRVFEIATTAKEFPKPIFEIFHKRGVWSLCFSYDGNRIATGCHGRFVRIFDIATCDTAKLVFKTIDLKSVCWSVCFAPDGKSIMTAVTGSEDIYSQVFVIHKDGDAKVGSDDDDDYDDDDDNDDDDDDDDDDDGGGGGGGDDDDDDGGGGGGDDDDGGVSGFFFQQSLDRFCPPIWVDGESNGKMVVFPFDDGDDHSDEVQPCMIFPGQCLAVSSQYSIAFCNDDHLYVLPRSRNFANECVWFSRKTKRLVATKPFDGYYDKPENVTVWGIKYKLPISPWVSLDLLLVWSRLPRKQQKQCFSDSQVIRKQIWAPDGGGILGLVRQLNSSDIQTDVETLMRLFKRNKPLVNPGKIMCLILDDFENKNTNTTHNLFKTFIANIRNHTKFDAFKTDFELTKQLVRAFSIRDIKSMFASDVKFWKDILELVPSTKICVFDVHEVSFSESDGIRMYVAGSDSTSEPVFKEYFKEHKQARGQLLEFEHFYVPVPYASAHRDGEGLTVPEGNPKQLMQVLVDTGNIDVFDIKAIRAIVYFKWLTFGRSRWQMECFIYTLGLALLVALGILSWQYSAVQLDKSESLPPADIAIVSALFATVITRSLWREAQQFSRINKHWWGDPWNWLDLLHIILGIAAVILVWAQSPKAVPVLAVTAYLRWWGALFYLRVFDAFGPFVRMLFEIITSIRWFLFIMLISILATWNAFTLLLKRQCLDPDASATCEQPRSATSVFRNLYDAINTLLFGNGDLPSLENTEYFGLVVAIFIISMISMPIILLNLLIAIMGHSYEKIQDRSETLNMMMKANVLVEIESFMTDSEKKNNSAFFPKFIHVIAPKGDVVLEDDVRLKDITEDIKSIHTEVSELKQYMATLEGLLLQTKKANEASANIEQKLLAKTSAIEKKLCEETQAIKALCEELKQERDPSLPLKFRP